LDALKRPVVIEFSQPEAAVVPAPESRKSTPLRLDGQAAVTPALSASDAVSVSAEDMAFGH